nr:MAG TPA: hypothetical protein [Caudoviricetes sp.]
MGNAGTPTQPTQSPEQRTMKNEGQPSPQTRALHPRRSR